MGTYGGKNAGDLYGLTKEEQSTSTKYKTIYSSENNSSKDYETSIKNKGDAVYEVSESHYNETGSWFAVDAFFPNGVRPFFDRGGRYYDDRGGIFYFGSWEGDSYSNTSFRPVLVYRIFRLKNLKQVYRY